MASEDNVVKLKHLQPFANGFSIPNGDNVVRLKHLVSLASAIADETVPSSTQQPVLSLGSWSAADSIYSAEIFYNGDGTLSTDIGSISNGVLTVEDVDGNFSGVLTATSTLNFSLISSHLIKSFTISPGTLSVTAGDDPVTAEITITTDPDDAPYQLSIPDAPEWVSIDDTTIIFTPPTGTTEDNYLFTVIATTKDDRAEFTVTLAVKQLLIPSYKIGTATTNEATSSSGLCYYKAPATLVSDGEFTSQIIKKSGDGARNATVKESGVTITSWESGPHFLTVQADSTQTENYKNGSWRIIFKKQAETKATLSLTKIN